MVNLSHFLTLPDASIAPHKKGFVMTETVDSLMLSLVDRIKTLRDAEMRVFAIPMPARQRPALTVVHTQTRALNISSERIYELQQQPRALRLVDG